MYMKVSPTRVFFATILKELRISFRYRANLIGAFYQTMLMVFAFYIFGNAISFRTLDMVQGTARASSVFLFFISGILLVIMIDIALWMPLNSVNNDLYNGTLEYLYSTPFSRFSYFSGTIVASAFLRMIFLAPVMVGIVFFGELTNEIWALLLVVLVTTVSLIGVGIIIALSAILWKETSGIVQILGMLFQFIAGAFIPVQSFPIWLKWIAFLFPQTFAFDLSRHYTFRGNWPTLLPVFWEWTILVLSIPFYFFLSLKLLQRVEKHARNQGLHLI
ncbi:MAG: ABC transporter permease [Methanobacteriota archaeon]|nr:MAG: ABC transporter permease [Euryarchaeota archaeon]